MLICAAAGAALLALAVKAYLDSTFKNQANSGQGGSLPNQQAGGNTTPAMPDPEDGDDPSSKLTSSQEKSIRSYEKRIAEHEAKLAEFKANSTVRPGMEHLPRSVIEQKQAARIRHLEVDTHV